MNDGDDSRHDGGDEGEHGDDPGRGDRANRTLPAEGGVDATRVDAEAAIQLVRILLIALIESQHIDAERLREVVDDVVSADHDGDAVFRDRVSRRVEEVARASYAVAPSGQADDIFRVLGKGRRGGTGTRRS